MAYSDEDWLIVKTYYEQGYSLAEIVNQEKNKAIKDRASISKKAKKEGWIKGINATLVEKNIKLNQLSDEICAEKATLNATELDIINSIVQERTKALQFFTNITHKNLSLVDKKIGKESTLQDHYLAQTTYQKGRETWLGKEAAPAVQINQNAQSIEQLIQSIDG